MIKNIRCVKIPVSSMEKAVGFYETVLGLNKTYAYPTWTAFDIGGTQFALATSGTKEGEKKTELCRSCSPCVFRDSAGEMRQNKAPAETPTSVIYLEVDDLDSIYQSLKEKGVKFIAEPRKQAWGGKTAPMLDPDKNILVLTQYS